MIIMMKCSDKYSQYKKNNIHIYHINITHCNVCIYIHDI